jgi:hypothetical protein
MGYCSLCDIYIHGMRGILMSPAEKINTLNRKGASLLADLNGCHLNILSTMTQNNPSQYNVYIGEEERIVMLLEDCDELIDHYQRLHNLELTWND